MKKILPAVLSAALVLTSHAAIANTEKNAPSDWAADSVPKAEQLHITDKNEAYSYSTPITRESFCELIYNYLENITSVSFPVNVGKPFNDTDNNRISILNAMGIIQGKADAEFAPNDFLTREEAATVLFRLINKVYPYMANNELYYDFTDKEQISDWAKDNIQFICNAGIMSGVEDNKFAPKDLYTAEQAIVTLIRVYEKFNDANIGIIGGADGPTQIIVGDDTTVIDRNRLTVTDTTTLAAFYTTEATKLATENAELAADKNFIQNYTSSHEMAEKIYALASADYSTPSEIYCISANREEIIKSIQTLYADTIDIEKMYSLNKVNFAYLASLINASYGSENLAATSILSSSRGYVMPKDFKNNFALYLQYDGEYSVLVSFSKYGDGVINAAVSFVKNGEADNIFIRLYELSQFLGESCISTAKVIQ